MKGNEGRGTRGGRAPRGLSLGAPWGPHVKAMVMKRSMTLRALSPALPGSGFICRRRRRRRGRR